MVSIARLGLFFITYFTLLCLTNVLSVDLKLFQFSIFIFCSLIMGGWCSTTCPEVGGCWMTCPWVGVLVGCGVLVCRSLGVGGGMGDCSDRFIIDISWIIQVLSSNLEIALLNTF